MDNLTHSLVGLAASKAGLERLSPGTTALCVLAANAPDADILALVFGDRWTYLHHHRGITHSIVGTLLLAILLPLVFVGLDRLIALVRKSSPKLRLKGLLLASLIVSATHPFMDWTNNYGIRPLLPWDTRWVYGDLVFIVDPFIWLLLGGAVFLVTSETKKQKALWIFIGALTTALVLFANRPGVGNMGSVRVVWVFGVVLLLALAQFTVAKRLGQRFCLFAFALLV